MKKILTFAAVSTFVVLGAGFFVQGASACFCEIPECNCCSNCGCQIPGCTDPDALNYDPCATVDDGSCEYEAPERYSIFGKKFNDENGNGVYEQGEPGLAGWTITIDNGACFEESTITDSEGNYSFSSLNPGTYTVCELEEEGWIQTYPNSAYGCYAVELADADIYGIDFGNYQEPAQPFIIKAYKVVCDKEEDLPNWTDSGAPSIIEQGTAQDYVDQSQGACHLEADWAFQWGYSDAPKLSGDYVGQAPIGTGYSEWKNFDSSTAGSGEPAIVQIDDLQSSPKIWVREVLKQGYVPFTNPPKGVKEDNVSAEMYCHNDILNYDNYDYIINPELGQTYYCVAFNALIEQEVLGCTDPDALNYNPDATLDDGSCQYDEPDKYSIFGLKFSDQNNNGANDSEPGLAGWTIVLTDTDSLNSTTVTDTEGNYSFLNLYPGTYTVCEEQQQGWIQTYPSGTQACHIVELTDSDASGIDFGNYQETVEILGCTDPDALNYNPDATLDDGSCQYEIPGCMDPSANNYNPQATVSNGSCTYGGGGSVRPRFNISKTVEQDFVNPGGEAAYTIVVECLGSGVARNTVLTDDLPEGFVYQGEADGTWELGDMQRGDKETITYEVLVSEDAEPGFYENTAKVQAQNSDQFKAKAEIEVRNPEVKGKETFAELQIEKTVDKSSAKAGSYVIFTVKIKNNGSADAINVVVEDKLPSGFITDEGKKEISWEIDIIEKGETWQDSFRAYIDSDTPDGSYENEATAFAENYPDEVEDTAVVVLGVLPHTGEGLFDSALFYLVFIVLVVACLELLRTVVKTRLAKVIVFSLVAFACLMVLTYPFWPMAEYAVCDWVKTEIQSEEKPAEDTPLSASSALRADLQGNYLVISKIGVEIPIVQGQDESALEKGAWLIPQTSTPDLMKNTALAAHRFKYKPPHKETFYLLDKVSKGDKILVLWEGKEYYYTVNSVSVVDPAYVEVLKETENPTLTLITCHPLFSDKSRLVVQAELEL